MLSEIVMQRHDKSHRTAVTDNVTEAVLFFQNISYFRIQNTDRSVDLVICRHNALCAAILNTSAEWLQIQLIFVSRVNGRIFPSAADLRIVSIEMLQGRCAAQILRIIALHSPDISAGHFSGQHRILSVAFLVSSPSRIALKINGRCPSAESMSLVAVPYNARLGSRYFTGLSDQLRVPGCTHTDRLWEGCCHIRFSKTVLIVSALNAVCRLTAHRDTRNAKARQIRGRAGEVSQFFFDRHFF